MSSLQTTWIILKKELLDAVRDRRYFATALIMPLLMPCLFAAMMSHTVSDLGSEKKTAIGVANPEAAPMLVAYLEQHGLEILPAPQDPEAAVRGGELDAVLMIPKDYAEKFSKGTSVILPLIQDESRMSTTRTRKKTEGLIAHYSGEVAALRMFARGVDPQLLRPVVLDTQNLATPEQKGSRMLDFLSMTILMATMMANMYVATDVAAGERERRSLEPLLTTPATRVALVIGKWLATAIFGIGGVFLSTLFGAVAVSQVPLENLGFRVVLDPAALCLAFLLMIPLTLFGGALQLAISAQSRSFKEAQVWQSVTLFLPMIPGLYLTFSPQDPALWMMPIPGLGQHMMLSTLLQGEPIVTSWMIASVLGCGVGTLLSLAATHAIFSQESILTGR